jgi:SRSO17 transposase
MYPGERKSIEPLAARVAPGEHDQLHHFVAVSEWDCGPLEQVLLDKADEMVGGEDAHLIIDDTALPKKGAHSVGVAHQYCGQLGKQANCQVLVSATLAREEVPVPVALRLYMPESWCSDPTRRKKAKVPEEIIYRPKWKIALGEIERIVARGVRFGDILADAGYGSCAEFRHGLTEMKLTWAVGILSTQRVYPRSVQLRKAPFNSRNQPLTHPVPTLKPRSAKNAIATLAGDTFRTIAWREGTKGPLEAEFAAVRVRVADGQRVSRGVRLPGEEAWLVCERRQTGEVKYYLTNHPADTPLETIAGAIKARWACEQAHQQLKEELGLDHFEGRSWLGLHHHTLLTMIAFAYLQSESATEPLPDPSPAKKNRQMFVHASCTHRSV